MKNRYEQKFYSKLEDTFIGQKINGESGYVNLMSIKSQYFKEISPYIEKKINKTIEPNYREELFEKLYNFFDCYLNETGTVFFANTQIHKNLYEKVYSDRDDVSLFWKTQKLYYVKSEVNFQNLDIEVNGIKIKFDASEMKNTKGNEKKSLKFFLIKATSNELIFKVRYAENNEYKIIKEYLEFDDIDKSKITNNQILDKLNSEYGQDIHANIKFVDSEIDRNVFINLTDNRRCLYIENCYDLLEMVKVEYSISDIELIMKYLISKNVFVSQEELIKTFNTYKRQNEIDYFIHKDAEGFLKEQFDIYIYNWLFNDLKTDFDVATVKRIQNLKKIAHSVIKYIAKFEDELKAIWEKPKFVRKCNYVFTLDRLTDAARNKILKLDLTKQIAEWKELNLVDKKFKHNNLVDNINDLLKLPIDTKNLSLNDKSYILSTFDNLHTIIDGTLIKSDNWQALTTISSLYDKQVRCIYIDPPFNTGNDFEYKDGFQDSTWLSLMSDRIKKSCTLMKEDGVFFLHLDDNANDLGKLLLKNHFQDITEIIYDTNATKDEEADLFGYKSFGNNFQLKHQTIFYCRKSNKLVFNKLWKPNRRETKLSIGWLDLIAKANKLKPTKIIDYDFFIEEYIENELELVGVNVDGEKLFPIGDIWSDIFSFTQSEMRVSESFAFTSSQKPENLLRRIIQSSSNQREIILDFFVGIGTAPAVAHKLNRKWIAVDLGEHINEFYTNSKNEQKLGVLGRLKWVLFGDRNIITPDSKRRPHLTKDIKWMGGGFFKYYELEQYEDVLAKAKYKYLKSDENNTNHIESYSFMQDEKLLDAIEIDYENNNAKVMFENLYPDVDIAETLSNLSGKHIKHLFEDRVIFEDNTEIIYDEMTFEKYPWIKPLIWWNSKK